MRFFCTSKWFGNLDRYFKINWTLFISYSTSELLLSVRLVEVVNCLVAQVPGQYSAWAWGYIRDGVVGAGARVVARAQRGQLHRPRGLGGEG